MNQKESEKKQRESLRKFDKELLTYTGGGGIMWFLYSILCFICLILQAIPVQEIQNESWFSICMFSIWIPCCILFPYVNITEPFTPNQKPGKTYDKLKYLPVSKKQYRIVRMGYLFRYLWKMAAAALVVQCTFSLAFTKYLDIWNIIYVVAIWFVLPLIIGWLWLTFYGFMKELLYFIF